MYHSLLKAVRHGSALGMQKYKTDFPENLKKQVFRDLLGHPQEWFQPWLPQQQQRGVGRTSTGEV